VPFDPFRIGNLAQGLAAGIGSAANALLNAGKYGARGIGQLMADFPTATTTAVEAVWAYTKSARSVGAQVLRGRADPETLAGAAPVNPLLARGYRYVVTTKTTSSTGGGERFQTEIIDSQTPLSSGEIEAHVGRQSRERIRAYPRERAGLDRRGRLTVEMESIRIERARNP